MEQNANPLYQQAIIYLSKKDYTNAITCLKLASQQCDPQAMYEYGLLYVDGLGVKKSPQNVLYCMRHSAELGYNKAILFLLDSYYNGEYKDNLEVEYLKKLFFVLSEEEQELNFKYLPMLGIDNWGEETESQGFFSTSSFGELKKVNFEIPEVEEKEDDNYDKIFYEEKNNLQNCLNEINAQIKNLSGFIQEPEHVSYYDEDWMEEIEKRANNKKYYGEIASLKKLYDKPYVGRMLIKYNTGVRDCYIGNSDFLNSNIISWYSDIGGKFYDTASTEWNVNGNKVSLVKKREISIEKSNLVSVFESFNISNTQLNSVIYDKYLLSVINSKRKKGTVSDIVATIQYNQNQIIRHPHNKNLIMQGCAGCGKTMVLFHRLKYLIGNKFKSTNDICVITPSAKFNVFVEPLLSDLELRNINIFSISDIYINILDEYTKKPDLTGGLTFSMLFKKGLSLFGFSPLKLESDDELPLEVVRYYYSKEFIDKVNSMPKVKINPLNKSSFNSKNKLDENGNIDILNSLLGSKEKAILPKYDRKKGVIHKCELFALCLYYYKRCAKNKYQEKEYTIGSNVKRIDFSFDYMMIDEAQSLSLSEYIFLKQYNNTPIFNLFGDTKQLINSYGVSSWEELEEISSFDIYELNKNYRNTSQIIKYVNKNCNVDMELLGIEGEEVSNVNLHVQFPKILMDDKHTRKAFICSESQKKNLSNYVPEGILYTVREVAGMEFDSVYLYRKGMTENEYYVAATRALNCLTVVED